MTTERDPHFFDERAYNQHTAFLQQVARELNAMQDSLRKTLEPYALEYPAELGELTSGLISSSGWVATVDERFGRHGALALPTRPFLFELTVELGEFSRRYTYEKDRDRVFWRLSYPHEVSCVVPSATASITTSRNKPADQQAKDVARRLWPVAITEWMVGVRCWASRVQARDAAMRAALAILDAGAKTFNRGGTAGNWRRDPDELHLSLPYQTKGASLRELRVTSSSVHFESLTLDPHIAAEFVALLVAGELDGTARLEAIDPDRIANAWEADS
jgi:hypothetical protein